VADYFAVVRLPGPAWDHARAMTEQEGWPEHAAFMNGLAESGAIVLGGPLGEGQRRFLLVFDAESERQIEDRLAEDPWTPAGMLTIASIDRWSIVLDREADVQPR
jgi:uncharacterized protein YciI